MSIRKSPVAGRGSVRTPRDATTLETVVINQRWWHGIFLVRAFYDVVSPTIPVVLSAFLPLGKWYSVRLVSTYSRRAVGPPTVAINRQKRAIAIDRCFAFVRACQEADSAAVKINARATYFDGARAKSGHERVMQVNAPLRKTWI